MKKLLIATHNPGKVKNYQSLLKKLPLKIVTLKQLGVTKDVEETENTFKKNAIKKATFFGKLTGLPTIADDSGLEVDYLNGEPGIHSRRWGGRRRTDDELVQMLLRKMKGVPWKQRGAAFAAVTALYIPGRPVITHLGKQRGIITEQASRTTNPGYPYNQVFYLTHHKKTLAEVPSFYTSEVSHRNKNITKLIPAIKKYIINV